MKQIGTAPEKVPFAIPEKWKWVELGKICIKTFSGGTPSKDHPEYWNGEIAWASIKDLSQSTENLSYTKDHITQCGLENSSAKLVQMSGS